MNIPGEKLYESTCEWDGDWGIGMGWSDVGTSNCSLVYLYLYYIVTRALCRRRCLSVVLQHQQHNNYTKTKGWLCCGGRKVDGILKFR